MVRRVKYGLQNRSGAAGSAEKIQSVLKSGPFAQQSVGTAADYLVHGGMTVLVASQELAALSLQSAHSRS